MERSQGQLKNEFIRRSMMEPFYPKEIEKLMKRVYHQLSEKDRRLYSAVEAEKLPHGGKTYIANLFRCSRETLYDGIEELHHPNSLPDSSRIRRSGAGAPKALEKYPELEELFLKIVSEHTAGSPQNEKIKWTHLHRKEICQKLEELGIKVSVNVVRDLLKKHNYRKRKMSKKKSIGVNKHRNEQFEKIAELKKEYLEEGQPVISVDGKKKKS
jgi:hypothetical protein